MDLWKKNLEIFKQHFYIAKLKGIPFKVNDCQCFPFAAGRVAEIEVLLLCVTGVRVRKENLGQGH